MGWRGRKERIFYEPVEKCTWTTVHHDDEVKSGRNILLIFTGYIVRACRYVAPIPEFFFPHLFPSVFSLSLSLVSSVQNANTYTRRRGVMCHTGEKRS